MLKKADDNKPHFTVTTTLFVNSQQVTSERHYQVVISVVRVTQACIDFTNRW